MPFDPRLEPIRAALPKEVDRSLPPDVRRKITRERHERIAPTLVGEGPTMLEERDLTVPTPEGGVPVRSYRPREGVLPGMLYVHGGGWWMGTLDDSDFGCRQRAAWGDCVVVSVGYRLAPEHPFPAGLDDCVAASRWVIDNADLLGIDPDRVVIAGSSAGGNIAAAAVLRLRDQDLSPFAGMLLEVPGVDLTKPSSPSMRDYAEGYGFSVADIEECVRFYVAGHDPADPLVSPVYADPRGLPPTLITTSEYDPFRDDAEHFAKRLASAGVAVTHRRFDGMAHGTAELEKIVPEIAAEYAALIQGFLRQTLHGQPDRCR